MEKATTTNTVFRFCKFCKYSNVPNCDLGIESCCDFSGEETEYYCSVPNEEFSEKKVKFEKSQLIKDLSHEVFMELVALVREQTEIKDKFNAFISCFAVLKCDEIKKALVDAIVLLDAKKNVRIFVEVKDDKGGGLPF